MKFLLALVLGLTAAAGVSARQPAKAPTIVSQKTDFVYDDLGQLIDERYIDIKNPLDKAVWVWLECESHLTTNAIGVAGRHTSEYTFDGIPSKEKCWINHWVVQAPGRSPPQWEPSGD